MPNESEKQRVSIGLPKATHEKLAHAARLLGKEIREAADEACLDWVSKNASRAQKRANELLRPA